MEAVTTFGDTALHDAAGYGQAAFCKMLLRRGANVRAKSTKGKTPLDYAHARGYPGCLVHLHAFEDKLRSEEAAARAADRERLGEEAAPAAAPPAPAVAAPAAASPRGGGVPKTSPRSPRKSPRSGKSPRSAGTGVGPSPATSPRSSPRPPQAKPLTPEPEPRSPPSMLPMPSISDPMPLSPEPIPELPPSPIKDKSPNKPGAPPGVSGESTWVLNI